MTGAQYIESLKRRRIQVYAFGRRVEQVVGDPLFQPHIEAAALTYDLAHDPDHRGLATAESHLSGKVVNRFAHVHQSPADLVKKIKLLRLLGQKTGTCFQRCVGFDALNAVNSVTFEMDERLGTDYHRRFSDYLRYVQDNDLMLAGSMTDPKGNRGLKPSQQADPDLYVRVVERRPDGIVVRGAKVHQTGMINSHEFLVMPGQALGPEDADYAVCFALPVDAPGVIHVFGRQTNDTRRLEASAGPARDAASPTWTDTGNPRYGAVGGEAITILSDVFVPRERVFMCGEHQFAGLLVERFATYHRANYGGCKAGVADVITGASAAVARSNGVEKAHQVRDKLAEMVHLTETAYAGSIAASAEAGPLPSGQYFVDPLLANTVKLNITRFIFEIGRLAQDITGGLLATLPSAADFAHPETGSLLTKYFRGADPVSTEHRVKLVRLIEHLSGGTALVESLHGAGSPQAQRVMILRQGRLEEKEKLAEELITPSEGRQ